MLNIASILKTISQNQQNQPEISTFSSWLMQNCDSEEILTPDHLQIFFQECLEYPHWVQNKGQLGQQIQKFIETYCFQNDLSFPITEVQFPSSIQLVEIESLSNWVDVINSYLTLQYKNKEKFRLIHDEHLQLLLAVVLYPNGNLHVRQFNKKTFIKNGTLFPLREDLELQYDSNFELLENRSQKIEIGPFMTARFILQDHRNYGLITRGYLFQKYQSMNNDPLIAFPKLFYTLKRIEQHFLKRESDPFYQDTIESLEHGVRMIRLGDENFIENAPDLLAKAQNALDYVFIGDKLLSLLIRDLQYTMASKRPVESKDTQTWTYAENPDLKTLEKPLKENLHSRIQKMNRPLQPPLPRRRPQEPDLTN